jgi:hypothetical protein
MDHLESAKHIWTNYKIRKYRWAIGSWILRKIAAGLIGIGPFLRATNHKEHTENIQDPGTYPSSKTYSDVDLLDLPDILAPPGEAAGHRIVRIFDVAAAVSVPYCDSPYDLFGYADGIHPGRPLDRHEL